MMPSNIRFRLSRALGNLQEVYGFFEDHAQYSLEDAAMIDTFALAIDNIEEILESEWAKESAVTSEAK